ncbi:unnamed protein product [Phytophthora fragariaefolia]|uniref:Unnamed protein product n=1 Tax=Phytophthora fragariaefolia TaxID=1490495 RepID=A0A9W6YQH4_9STRA|nr:unnamed protein product [Phytophthora fragariaefolia]
MVVSSTFKVGQIWLVTGNTTSLADIHVAEFLLPQQQQSNTMNVIHAIMNASDDETDTPSRQEQERPAQQCFMEFDLPQQYHSLQQQLQQTPQNLQSDQVRLQPHHELFQDAAIQTPVRSHAGYQAPHVPGLMTQSTQSHALPQPEAHARRLRVKCETEVADYFARAASIYESADDTIADTYGHDDSNDPLLWWKRRSIHFPVLSQLARKWLGCVATSVPSERAFSTAENIVSAKRSALDPDAVRDLIFIHENYADETEL